MGIFKVPLLNSLRWVEKDPVIDPRYNKRPFDLEIDQYNPNGCYYAKWQTNDKAQVQVISDYVPELNFYHYATDRLYKTIAIPESPTNILDVTYKCYEAEIDFSEFDEGDYYGQLEYNDGSQDKIWQTSPISVADLHKDTILYEYKNSINDYGVVFDTGIVFNFRVEGGLYSPLFKSNTEQYTDQKYNITQEDSIPFRNFSHIVGTAEGVPNWVIDKCNRIFAVDQKQINGVFYERAEAGSEFEPTRNENSLNQDGFWSLAVIPKDNNNLEQYTTGDEPINQDYVVIRKNEPRLNIAANIAISGVFRERSVLDYIAINNKTFSEFTLLIGTSNGGSEIGTWDIPTDVTSVKTIRHRFNSAQTLYLSGITETGGLNIDFDFIYDQADAVPVIPSGGGVAAFPIGFGAFYEEINDGDFEIQWDGETGLGKAGAGYEGWAISGTNGTIDRKNTFMIGWDSTQPITRDTIIGSNSLTLTKEQLPVNNVTFGKDRKGGNAGVDVLSASTAGVTGQIAYNMGGSGNPIDIRPRSLVTMWIVKITA